MRPEINYFEHQVEGVRWLARRTSWLLCDEQGLGKLAPLSEPTLTPSGWRPMGEIQLGDHVIGRDGKPTKVVGVFPQGRKEIFKVTFNDGSWTRCGEEHLWQVQRRIGSHTRGFVLTTAQLMDPDGEVEWHYDGANGGVARTYRQKTHYLTSQGYGRWNIPMVEPVQFRDPGPLPVHPYTLGAYLGDGSFGANQGKAKFTSKTDVEWFAVHLNGLIRGPGKEHTFDSTTSLLLKRLGLKGHHSWEKFVPEQYLRASEHDRRMLLAGLMDTDGHAGEKHTEYCTTSPMLRDAVVELVQSLGGVARVREKPEPAYEYEGAQRVGRLAYRVNVKLPVGDNPFRLPRKYEKYKQQEAFKYPPARRIVSIEPDGFEEAQCIKVDAADSLYVTRNYIVTHNTIQSLTVAALDFDRGWAKRVLVICTASLKANWASEIEEHTLFSYQVLEGSVKQKRKILDEFDSDILIVNYEQVISYPTELLNLKFDIVIVDECQAIKNFGAQRTAAVHRLMPRRWFLLSGTPLETRPDELWSPLRLIDPVNTPHYWTWVNSHCVFATGTRQVVGVKKAERLRQHIEQVFLRRLKKDCLDLPEKQHIKVNIDLSPYQRRLHDQAEKELMLQLPKDPDPMELESGLMKALRLRQICSTPANLEGLEDDSAKLDAVIAKLLELRDAGHKAVVFCKFRPTIDCLVRRCEAAGIANWVHHGGIKLPQRKANQRAWEAHEGGAAFIGMYSTMGVGLTLTAARHVLIVDKEFGPGAMKQAEDRCIVGGQLVLTRGGYRPIESVKIGDEVITKSGRPATVTDAWSSPVGRKDIIEIDLVGAADPLTLTSDHRVWVASRTSGEPSFVEARHVLPGDKLMCPGLSDDSEIDCLYVPARARIPELHLNGNGAPQRNGRAIHIPDELRLDLEAMFAIGYFIADGSTFTGSGKGRYVSFAGNDSSKAKAMKRVERWVRSAYPELTVSWLKPSPSDDGRELRVYSGELARAFAHWFGADSKSKRLPYGYLEMSVEQIRSFFEGYLAGDGHLRKNQVEWCSVSEELAHQLTALALKIGARPTLRRVSRGPNAGHWIGGWTTSLMGQPGEATWRPVRSVTTRHGRSTDPGLFDLTVEGDDPSFIVGTAAVHNCHRIGADLTQPVQIIEFIARNTYEQRIEKILNEKGEMVNELIPNSGWKQTLYHAIIEGSEL